jgi:2-methylaconitate cis-trans-isomerase PrpF
MASEFRKIPCVIQRGGTSKAVYLHSKDLPEDQDLRTKVILSIFGSPDRRQIDGLGGAEPLTSKVAVIAPSERPGVDVDYTFGAVDLFEPIVDLRGNCGNISSGVGPFAVDEGLVKATGSETIVRIYNTNTDKILKAFVPTLDGKARYTGDFHIDGVPGTASKILLDYCETAGAVTGKLLPTGNPVDKVNIPSIGELEISIVDAANPMVFVRAEAMGFKGTEGPLHQRVLDALDKIELVRGTAAEMIGMVDRADKARMDSPAQPMLAFVSAPQDYTAFTDGAAVTASDVDLVSRGFYMQEMHKLYAGTGTVCTGTAAMIEGTVVNAVTGKTAFETNLVRIGHPSGVISIEVEVEKTAEGFHLKKAAFARTSKRIMEGMVNVPESIFQ